MKAITHPLKEGQIVVGNKPVCPCTGQKFKQVSGIIKKVIRNQSGYWYYLDSGITIKDNWIISVK